MSAPMMPEQRKAIAKQLGDAKPATAALLGSLAESVANVRTHDHPAWEDLYCMNLTAFMGERMAPVLRRLVDAEAEAVHLRARLAELEAAESKTVADRDAQIIAWLTKKAGEYRGLPRSRQESAADAIARMADKISRSAVRGTETASPWERAVAGLNALVDADVIFHVEPDGHISAPFSDEHIEWDLKARRWVLTRDDEDGAS